MGLFCKGLHCAGCGKGIPLGIVVTLIAIAVGAHAKAGNAIGGAVDALANALIAIAVIGGVCVIIAAAIVATVIRKGHIYTVSRWEGPTYSEQKQLKEAGYRTLSPRVIYNDEYEWKPSKVPIENHTSSQDTWT